MTQPSLSYLDNAATSFPKPDVVVEAVANALRSSPATAFRRGYDSVESTQTMVADSRAITLGLLGASAHDDLVFTLNATDAANGLLNGLLKRSAHVVTGPFEHSAISRTLTALRNRGHIDFDVAKADHRNMVTAELVEPLLTDRTALLSLCHVSNVTGDLVVDPDVGVLARERGIPLLLDICQSAGAVPLSLQELGADFAVFSGHKSLLGPSGVGCLYMREGHNVGSFRFGGIGIKGESDVLDPVVASDYETGTQNVAGIAGFHAAVGYLSDESLPEVLARKAELAKRLVRRLAPLDHVSLVGRVHDDERAPIVAFNVGTLPSQDVGEILDRAFGIATRAGLHCAPWAHRSLGTFPHGVVRASVGAFTTADEIDKLADAVESLAELA